MIQIYRGGMSINASITAIIISVNWIAISCYIRVQRELYGIIILNPAALRKPHSRVGTILRSFPPFSFFKRALDIFSGA